MSKISPLIIIVILSAILRLVYINYLPPSLNWDEVSLGYNAYSLLKTGRDEWGTILPTIFRAYGDYKLPVYVYFAAVSPFMVRLPSIMFGIAQVLIVYLIAKRFFSHKIGVMAALLVAISPWTLFLSRVAVEANLVAFFIAAGIYCLLIRRLSSGILLLGISVWTYNSARIFVPLFIFIFYLINRKSIKLSFFSYFLFSILFIPMFFQLFSSTGQARYQWLAILDSGAIAKINELRSRPGGRFVYNKLTYFISQFSLNYLNHFHPSFLFLKGGTHYQFSIPNQSLVYLINLPFFIIGFIYILRTKNWMLLFWLLLAPIPDSLTRDSPHVLRSITLLPLPMILSGLGVVLVARKIKNKLFIPAYLITVFLSLSLYINEAVSDYQKSYSWAWQYGYKQAVQLIKEKYEDYDQIIITKKYGEPHEFVLFFWPWDPEKFLSDPNLNRYYRSTWYWVDSFAKFKFVNDWEMVEVVKNLPPNKKYLVISSPENETTGSEISRINFLDGKPAFIVKQL